MKMNVDRPGQRIRLPWQKERDILPPDGQALAPRRVPLVGRLPLKAKNHLVAMISEFVGTFLFLVFAFGGTNVANAAPTSPQLSDLAANPTKLLYIALCFGMSLVVNAWVFFRISGGLFNPAVTLGMMLVGAITYVRGILAIIAQILGAIAASAVALGLFPGPLNVSTSLGGDTSVVQGLFIEMFLTAQLVFTIFMLAAEKHRGTFIAPVGIGLSLFIAELVGVYYTGGSLNPARSFGPSVVLGSFPRHHWIYWVGPILGALLASGFYMLVKALEYETVSPTQDDSGTRGRRSNPATGHEEKAMHHVANVRTGDSSRPLRGTELHNVGTGSMLTGTEGTIGSGASFNGAPSTEAGTRQNLPVP